MCTSEKNWTCNSDAKCAMLWEISTAALKINNEEKLWNYENDNNKQECLPSEHNFVTARKVLKFENSGFSKF